MLDWRGKQHLDGLRGQANEKEAERIRGLVLNSVSRLHEDRLNCATSSPRPSNLYVPHELFVAHLAEGLENLGHDVVVYANGESTPVSAERRWYYQKTMWPPTGDFSETLKEVTHTAWAIRDASETCDIIHVNNTFGLPYSRFVGADWCTPFITLINQR